MAQSFLVSPPGGRVLRVVGKDTSYGATAVISIKYRPIRVNSLRQLTGWVGWPKQIDLSHAMNGDLRDSVGDCLAMSSHFSDRQVSWI